MSERRARVQGNYHLPLGAIGRECGTVLWAEHEEAWTQYAKRYGKDQSAERINDRWGFGYSEITSLLGHAPTTFTKGQ